MYIYVRRIAINYAVLISCILQENISYPVVYRLHKCISGTGADPATNIRNVDYTSPSFEI